MYDDAEVGVWNCPNLCDVIYEKIFHIFFSIFVKFLSSKSNSTSWVLTRKWLGMIFHLWAIKKVCVQTSFRERERERERGIVCVWVCVVCKREREICCYCLWERKRHCLCVCACVCEREREREKDNCFVCALVEVEMNIQVNFELMLNCFHLERQRLIEQVATTKGRFDWVMFCFVCSWFT